MIRTNQLSKPLFGDDEEEIPLQYVRRGIGTELNQTAWSTDPNYIQSQKEKAEEEGLRTMIVSDGPFKAVRYSDPEKKGKPNKA